MTETGPSPQQVEFLKKVAGEILIEFTTSITKEILRYSDRAKYYELASKKAVEEALTTSSLYFDAKKTGMERMITPGMFVFTMFAKGDPDKVDFEMRERGFIGTLHDCPWKGAVPEVCMFLCDIGDEVWSEAFPDPELESIHPNHMTGGDPFCRFVIKKRSETYKDPDSLGKVIKKLPMPDMPKEQIAQFNGSISATYWINSTIGFKMLNGPEKTNEVLLANAKRIGKNFGSSLIEANILPARDIAVMGGLIHQFREGYMMQGSITSMAPGVFAKEIIDCPFKNAPPEVCKQFEAFFNGALEAINPELEFHYDRMMTMGDKTCKWVIAKKGI
jgi:predicted hydrocarbon binding protein